MARRGRKPTPSKVVSIKGNPGKRKRSKKEPVLPPSYPKPPSILCKEAAAHWEIVCKQLFDAKVMTDLDIDALMMYCEAYARWIDAHDQVRTYGVVIEAPSGYLYQSPYLSIANNAFVQMKSILVEFGMTPSSRTRVQTTGGDTDRKDPWDSM